MAQKNRADITSAISSNVYDNTNKEILASMVRAVLTDFNDSFFNNLTDELKSKKYNSTQTLEEYLNTLIGSIPLKGSTDWFDPSSANGSVESYEEGGQPNNGIVSNWSYDNPNNERSILTVNFSQSIANREILLTIYTSDERVSSPQLESNYCVPIIGRVGSFQIKIGIREIGGYVGKIRIGIIAL